MDNYYNAELRQKHMIELEYAERELMARRRQVENREVASIFLEKLMELYRDNRTKDMDSEVNQLMENLRESLPKAVRVSIAFNSAEEATLFFTFRNAEIGRIDTVSLPFGGEIVAWMMHNRYMYY